MFSTIMMWFNSGHCSSRFTPLAAVALALSMILAGCSSKEHELAASTITHMLDEELVPLFVAESSGDASSAITSCKAFFSAVLRNDTVLRDLEFQVRGSEIGIEQSKSVLLPRIDVLVGANTAYSSNEGWDNRPELGLVLRYDLNSALFQEDYSRVAAAQRFQLLAERELAEKQALLQTQLLLSEYAFTNENLKLTREMQEVNRRLEQLLYETETVLPGGSGLDRKTLEQESFRNRLKRLSLQDELDLLREALTARAGQSIDFDSVSREYSEHQDVILQVAQSETEEKNIREIALSSLENSPQLRLFESKLYIARMEKLKTQRERLPRILASIGGGSLLDTGTVGTSDVVFKLQFLYPFFDAGDIDRKIRREELRLNQVQVEIRESFKRKIQEIREKTHGLRAAKQQADAVGEELAKHEKKHASLQALRELRIADETALLLSLNNLLFQRHELLEKHFRQNQAALKFIHASGLSFSPRKST